LGKRQYTEKASTIAYWPFLCINVFVFSNYFNGNSEVDVFQSDAGVECCVSSD
jgi:hypothetical protein